MTEGEEGHAWRTPGARKLVYDVLLEATNGRPCILRNRREGAVAAFCETAAGDFPCSVEIVQGHAGTAPQQALAELASPSASSAAHARLLELITGEELRETVVLVRVEGEALGQWVTFAGTFASARRPYDGPAASLVLLTPELCDIPSGCSAWNDDLIVDPLDALMFVRDRTNWPRSRLVQAASAVLVEVCRGDVDLMDRFLDLSPEQAFNPMGTIRAMAKSPDERLLLWRDRDEPCPHWLAARDAARLLQRVWRGQLSVLFPWLEEVRAEILTRGARKLTIQGICDSIGEPLAPEDFEFSQIAYALKQKGAEHNLVNAAHALRLIRNELAHCRPIEVTDLQAAESSAKRLIQALG